MDIEARQIQRRAIGVAAAATMAVALGQHAASRASADALSAVRQLHGDAGLADGVHPDAWGLTGDPEGPAGRPSIRVKPGSACPSGVHIAAPQLAQWDGKLLQE
jgi:hypothetical protein